MIPRVPRYNLIFSFLLLEGFLLLLCWAKFPITMHLQNYSSILANQDENRIFFTTHLRSGTNWTLYIMQYFTQRPSSYSYSYYEAYDLPLDFEKPFIHHCHDASFFNKTLKQYFYFNEPNISKDKLLLLIRDPTETFFRGKENFNEAVSQLYVKGPYGMESFFKNISFYDSWSSTTKLLIYYEDLINEPRKTIEKLLTFLNNSINSLDEFMLNYEEHKEKAIKYYNGVYHSYSKGNSVNFHQKKIFI